MAKKVHHHKLIWVISGLLAALFVITIAIYQFSPMPSTMPRGANTEVAPKTKLPYTASFEVIINGQKRVFNDPMYFNRSDIAYVEAANPSLVVVAKEGVTWGQFLATMPFSVDQNCIVTGNKETYCSNETQKLTFTINNQVSPDALLRLIKEGDSLSISY